VGGFQLAVSRYSAHFREAAELVEYLTSNKVQKSRVLREGYLPTVSQLYSDTDVLEAVPEAKVLRNARRESWVARPSSIAGAKYSALSRDYYQAVHQILTRQASPEKALEELEKTLVALRINARSGGG
jgi:trehalose/maltose transport system substrate-binding protein